MPCSWLNYACNSHGRQLADMLDTCFDKMGRAVHHTLPPYWYVFTKECGDSQSLTLFCQGPWVLHDSTSNSHHSVNIQNETCKLLPADSPLNSTLEYWDNNCSVGIVNLEPFSAKVRDYCMIQLQTATTQSIFKMRPANFFQQILHWILR